MSKQYILKDIEKLKLILYNIIVNKKEIIDYEKGLKL